MPLLDIIELYPKVAGRIFFKMMNVSLKTNADASVKVVNPKELLGYGNLNRNFRIEITVKTPIFFVKILKFRPKIDISKNYSDIPMIL